MFTVTGSEPVHGLSRDALWKGLVLKAEEPVRFVPAIARCRVLERTDEHLVREVELRGDRVVERVTYDPQTAVHFERLEGPVSGTIENRIEEDEGGMRLRFTFDLEVDGIEPGSAEEAEYAAMMARSYLEAVRTTLATTHELFGEREQVDVR